MPRSLSRPLPEFSSAKAIKAIKKVKVTKAIKATIKATKATKALVVKARKDILKVEEEGHRRYIRVPVGKSSDLHKFLRGQRIASAPPQPYYSDVDCIELDRSVDIVKVQGLLNAWSSPKP